MNIANIKPKYKQRGLSIVELMVAMVLTLILIIGVVQIYLSSKQAFRSQEDIARIQENGRYILDIMDSHIRMTDFPDTNIQLSGGNIVNTAGTILTGMYPREPDAISGSNSGSSSPDSITIRYFSSVDPCGGSVTGTNSTYTFSIATNVTDGINYLNCNNGTNNFDLVPYVENMQIQYGVDTDLTREPTQATRYLTNIGNIGTTVNLDGTSQLARERVVSVRIALLLRSENTAPDSCGGSYQLLDQSVTIPNTDCYLHKVIISTIKLRNRVYART